MANNPWDGDYVFKCPVCNGSGIDLETTIYPGKCKAGCTSGDVRIPKTPAAGMLYAFCGDWTVMGAKTASAPVSEFDPKFTTPLLPSPAQCKAAGVGLLDSINLLPCMDRDYMIVVYPRGQARFYRPSILTSDQISRDDEMHQKYTALLEYIAQWQDEVI
jgi:hypothetical protein